MKKLMALVLASAATGIAWAQPSVGASISINQPGVYGRIDIGSAPPPALVLPQPVLIAPPPHAVPRAPIYLYVPPAQQAHWRHYCGQYNACGQPVYFVREEWVRERYVRDHPDWERRHRHEWERRDGHWHDERGDGDGDRRGDGRR